LLKKVIQGFQSPIFIQRKILIDRLIGLNKILSYDFILPKISK